MSNFQTTQTTGGQSIYWGFGLQPIDDKGVPIDVARVPVGDPEEVDENTTRLQMAYPQGTKLKGQGNFKLDFLVYKWLLGMDVTNMTDATLATLELPPKIIAPLIVMIVASLLTRPNSKETLDRYYTKMKTPVDPDPEADVANLTRNSGDENFLNSRRLFPNSNFEFQKPTTADVVGFVLCFILCFAIIGLAVWAAGLGST